MAHGICPSGLAVRPSERTVRGSPRGRRLLPRARHLSKGIIERDVETTIPDLHADIVLYCGGGYRSALVADNLQRMGYTNVTSMDGGWRAWTESGFPTAKD